MLKLKTNKQAQGFHISVAGGKFFLRHGGGEVARELEAPQFPRALAPVVELEGATWEVALVEYATAVAVERHGQDPERLGRLAETLERLSRDVRAAAQAAK